MWADDATRTMHDQAGLVVTKEEAPAWYRDILETPETINWSTEVLAIRGDLLCLTRLHARRSGSGFGSDKVTVHEINASGLAVRDARYEAEDLRAAHDCLNNWWIENLPPELVAVFSTGLSHATQDGDRAGLDELLADDLVVTDNRPLSYGQTDKHGLLEAWMGLHDESPGSVMLQPTVDRLTTNGFVCTSKVVHPNGFETSGVAVMILSNGLFTNMEFFDYPDDLEQALARFDELTSTSPS
jgi:hypothetical protein